MKLGFTGTRKGMTARQRTDFVDLLRRLQPSEFHHGDCLGADAEAHDLVRGTLPACLIVIHPPDNDSQRAFKSANVTRGPKPYLARNRAIVNETDDLVATPGTRVEQFRGSGTWATIRYGLKKNPGAIVVLLPLA